MSERSPEQSVLLLTALALLRAAAQPGENAQGVKLSLSPEDTTTWLTALTGLCHQQNANMPPGPIDVVLVQTNRDGGVRTTVLGPRDSTVVILQPSDGFWSIYYDHVVKRGRLVVQHLSKEQVLRRARYTLTEISLDLAIQAKPNETA